jgi:hypothetical protein
MFAGASVFQWPVSRAGYEWVEVRFAQPKSASQDNKTWVMREKTPGDSSGLKRFYVPMEQATGLFRDFAGIAADDKDAMMAFANEYGMLGVMDWPGLQRELPTEWAGEPTPEKHFEVIGWWSYEIEMMRAMVYLWEMIKAGDTAGLKRCITDIASKEYNSPFQTITYLGYSPPAAERLFPIWAPSIGFVPPDDYFTAAALVVQHGVNMALHRHEVNPALTFQPASGRQVLQFMPSSLIGAMWLQLAQGVAGNKKFRACKECGKSFEISGEETGFRINRLFCSDSCKSRDYRHRKERALELKAAGKSPQAIAKELDTDVETIKKWTSRQKG